MCSTGRQPDYPGWDLVIVISYGQYSEESAGFKPKVRFGTETTGRHVGRKRCRENSDLTSRKVLSGY